MINPYLSLLYFILIVAAFLAVMLFLCAVLGPKYKTRVKHHVPFECGSIPVGDACNTRFGVKFYLLAMLFIIFDVGIVFIYPWALSFRELGGAPFIAMLVFIGILTVGFIYIWRKGVFDWNKR
ncbi:MAG: NADH-quinone oxidoreductase subunit A [Bdellovibrionota bacterium]|jgi:NADH-quinone oxidoreductase subunit A